MLAQDRNNKQNIQKFLGIDSMLKSDIVNATLALNIQDKIYPFKQYISQDVYAVLGDFRKPKDSIENFWVLRIYIKPFISFIWFGSLFVVLGGFLSLFTKKRNFSKNAEL